MAELGSKAAEMKSAAAEKRGPAAAEKKKGGAAAGRPRSSSGSGRGAKTSSRSDVRAAAADAGGSPRSNMSSPWGTDVSARLACMHHAHMQSVAARCTALITISCARPRRTAHRTSDSPSDSMLLAAGERVGNRGRGSWQAIPVQGHSAVQDGCAPQQCTQPTGCPWGDAGEAKTIGAWSDLVLTSSAKHAPHQHTSYAWTMLAYNAV